MNTHTKHNVKSMCVSFLGERGEHLEIGVCVEGYSVPVSLTSVKSNIFSQIDSFVFSSEEFFPNYSNRMKTD